MGIPPQFEATRQQLLRRYFSLKRRVRTGDVLLVALVFGVLLTLLFQLLVPPLPLWQLYGALGLITLMVWALLMWRVRVASLTVLMAADRTHDLQERLSTAYEYAQRYADHPFVPDLLADAERASHRVDPRLVFPWHFPRRLWGIPVCVVVLVVLERLDFAPLRFDDPTHDEVAAEVAREGERLERWGRKLEELAQQEQLDRSLILARHMKQLGRRLQQETGEKGQASERISTLSQYLERMQQELRERALMSASGSMRVRDVLASGKGVKQELQDILQLLKHDVLPGDIKHAAAESIQCLRRQVGKHPQLEELLRSLQAGNVTAARQLLQDILQKQQVAEEMEHLERAQRALQYSSRSIQRSEPGEAPRSRPTPGGEPTNTGVPFDFDDETPSEDMPGMEDFDTPGFGENYGFARHKKTRPNQPLRESDQEISQVRVKSSEGAMRLGYMRHLPLQNEAQVPIEQIVVEYQQAAEDVLAAEKIPRGYREQVKRYFLAIGIVPEEKP